MLEHEEPNQTAGQAGRAAGNGAADSARVTAEEFTAALRAIEERRARVAEHRAGTVDVGQTIKELGIDASPDEILAEIEADRKRRAQQDNLKSDVKAKAQKTASDAWDYASAAYETIRQRIEESSAQQKFSNRNGPITINVKMRGSRNRGQRRSGVGGLLFGLAMFWFMWSMFSGHMLIGLPGMFRAIGSSASSSPGEVMTLAKVPEGKTVYCSTSNLVNILKAGGTVSAADSSVEAVSNQLDNYWPITVHAGTVYLQGYMLPSAANRLTTGTVDILNDDNSGELFGESDDSVTVPLKDAKLFSNESHDGWSQVTVSGIAPDRFTQINTD